MALQNLLRNFNTMHGTTTCKGSLMTLGWILLSGCLLMFLNYSHAPLHQLMVDPDLTAAPVMVNLTALGGLSEFAPAKKVLMQRVGGQIESLDLRSAYAVKSEDEPLRR